MHSKRYFLGINLSHDASIALIDIDGNVLFALAEERISRIKFFTGWPTLAIDQLVKLHPYIQSSNLDIIIGSHSYFENQDIETWQLLLSFNNENYFDAINTPIPPGWKLRNVDPRLIKAQKDNLKATCLEIIHEKLQSHGLSGSIFFESHHQSHQASAFFASNFNRALVLSLDSQGDRESGRLSIFSRTAKPIDLYSLPVFFSLGYLYSQVTRRYGFKESRHEGKITGLAAFGDSNNFNREMHDLVSIKRGKIKFTDVKVGILTKLLIKIMRGSGYPVRPNLERTLDDIANRSSNFADLANFVQRLIERVIFETITYWSKKYRLTDVCLAGGVFSNVKVNQVIAEMPNLNRVFIYPNMGDGGLAVGSVWAHMMNNKIPISSQRELVFFYNQAVNSELDLSQFSSNNLSELESVNHLVKDLSEGKIIGIFDYPMEWGPRALCKRSIIALANNSNINKELNQRLSRTEFMPFAPIVRQEIFHEVFDSKEGSYLDPFHYMTMTCRVKEKWTKIIPAIVHIDGTARPQIVHKSQNPLIWKVLEKVERDLNLPCLINTSFNVHEEPIVFEIEQALNALTQDRVDVVYHRSEQNWIRIQSQEN